MREEAASAGVATTAAASGCSAMLFIVGLGVAAFITRDGGGPVHLPREAAADAGQLVVPVDAPDELDAQAVVSASLALEPVLVSCFKEAHARDPSAGRRAVIEVQVRLGTSGPEVVGGRVKAAPSPFFRPCITRQAKLAAPGEGSSRVLVADWDGEGVRLSVQNAR